METLGNMAQKRIVERLDSMKTDLASIKTQVQKISSMDSSLQSCRKLLRYGRSVDDYGPMAAKISILTMTWEFVLGV